MLLLKVDVSLNRTALAEGARNLLENCIGVHRGERVLIVREDASLGYFDETAPYAVAEEAQSLGAFARVMEAPRIDVPEDFPPAVLQAMDEADHTVFFARLGDQIRFSDLPQGRSQAMSYAPDARLLSSDYGRLPHQLMCELKDEMEARFVPGARWRITCHGGTDLSGTFEKIETPSVGEVTLHRFPLTTFRPVTCANASGKVALANWLIGTGSRNYEPFAHMIEELSFALVEEGRINGFEGPAESVENIKAHYDHVARLFGIDGMVVHSWHAGLHPQAFYPDNASDNLERWGGVAFANPRYLHFHTCGNYAPGEICWSCIDPTVEIDGVALWRDGHCTLFDEPEIQALFAKYPGFEDAWKLRTDIGL